MSWFIAVLSLVCGQISNVQCHCYELKWHRSLHRSHVLRLHNSYWPNTSRHDITWCRHSRWRIAIANSLSEPVLVSTVLIVLTSHAECSRWVACEHTAPVNHLRTEQRLCCSDVNVLGSLGHKCRVTAVACTLELSTNISKVLQCPEKAPTWPAFKHGKSWCKIGMLTQQS